MSRFDVRVGRIAGIPVQLNWTVLVLVWLLGSVLITRVLPAAEPSLGPGVRLAIGLSGAAAFLGSILAHELGHALVATRGGVKVESISLWLFGGVARQATEARKPGLALRIAAAGPGVSLLVGAMGLGVEALLAAGDVAPGAGAVIGWLGRINLLLAVFNLLPGLPLDGGRILEAALWARWRDRDRAVRAAATTGRLLGYGLAGLGGVRLIAGDSFGGLWLALIGMFLANAARSEDLGQRARRALDGVRVERVMSPVVPTVPSYLTVEEMLRDHVATQPYPTWVVRSWGGDLEGTVDVSGLARVPAKRRPYVHLRELALPPEEVAWARPDELVLDVLGRSEDDTVVVVGPDGQLVGMLSPGDVTRALDRRLGAAFA